MNIFKKTLILIMPLGFIHFAQADVPVHEDGGTQLMQHTMKVQQYSDKNETADEQRMKMDIERNLIEGRIDKTADQMGKMEALLTALQKLLDGQGSSLDIKDTGDWEPGVKGSLKLVQLNSAYIAPNSRLAVEGPPGGDPNAPPPNDPNSNDPSSADNEPKEMDYTSIDGKLLVEKLITIPPRWMDTTGKGGPPPDAAPKPAFYSPRTQKLLVKVAARMSQKLQKNMRSQRLEFLAYGMARDLLPEKLIASFNANKTVSYLLGKAGVVELGDGVMARPAAPQDAAFVKYANLDGDEKSATLFWSDPSVVDGYHSLLGTALNRTSLKGYKEVDMDNVISNGYSKRIEQYNMLQPPEKRIANPFRGYAAKVVPGLMSMVEQGQIKDGEIPNNQQLAMAIKLTKKLKMLPSQNMKIKIQKASFHFAYPPRVILVQGGPPPPSDGDIGKTGVVGLPDLERIIFEKSMFIAGKRLREINTLKDELRKGRHYADELIKILNELEQQEAISHTMMDNKSAIPQVTQMRKQIFDSMEHYRWLMSKLEYQYDDLLHREWTVLHHVLDNRNQAIARLLEDASIRYRTAITADQTEQSTQDQGGGTDDPNK